MHNTTAEGFSTNELIALHSCREIELPLFYSSPFMTNLYGLSLGRATFTAVKQWTEHASECPFCPQQKHGLFPQQLKNEMKR